MKKHYRLISIGKDGWPVEFIEGRPITNFIRRLIHTDHYECKDCWYEKQQKQIPTQTGSMNANSLAGCKEAVGPEIVNCYEGRGSAKDIP
jgi:hypothetical protein